MALNHLVVAALLGLAPIHEVLGRRSDCGLPKDGHAHRDAVPQAASKPLNVHVDFYLRNMREVDDVLGFYSIDFEYGLSE